MIKAKLVFRDAEGNLCPPGYIKSLEPLKLYADWAAGKLIRDVAVTLEKPDMIERALRDPSSPDFHLVGAEAYYAWGELDSELSLVPKLLAMYDNTVPGSQLVTDQEEDFNDVAWHAADVETAESRVIRARDKMYATYYWLSADVAHTADWYDRDPKEVVRDIILELLQKWTKRDNATLLHLLNTACNQINDIIVFKDFTLAAFNHIHTQVARWKMLVSHVLATARVLAQADPRMWEDVAMEPICLGAPSDVTWVDYAGSSRDQKDLFVCGHPSVLGARGVKVEAEAHPVKNDQTTATEYGWLWSKNVSTQITNSRAVVAGMMIED